jgi:hypothetical protein
MLKCTYIQQKVNSKEMDELAMELAEMGRIYKVGKRVPQQANLCLCLK